MNSLSRNNLIDVVNSTLLNDGRVINYKEIGKQMFVSCYNLKSIVLPDSIKSIGVYSFNNCNRLRKIVLSRWLENIGTGSFICCPYLKSIILPKSIIDIDDKYLFELCRSLKTITIPKNTIHNLLVRNSTVITY